MKKLILASAVGVLTSIAAGCGGSSTVKPSTLLPEAQRTLNAATSAHFVLASRNIPASGTNLRGGDGELARPDKLRGTFQVQVFGLPATVRAVAISGKFWALLPFQPSYKMVNPSEFGLGDPSLLISRDKGLSHLLTELQNPKAVGRERINGELVEKIAGTVTGPQIDSFLPDAAPSQPVHLTFAIDPSSHQVRQATATGPFVSKTTQSSYILTLTNYNEAVTITP
ncbi:MAG: LppX_LprAFG lipoprotein, partial [Acidimicrobiaceae bacterium]|nr:LppX_LprAFG lipoprotein [Acidimicrobiaceae bacterium]